VYELPLHIVTQIGSVAKLTGYLLLERRPGGDWASTWRWTKCVTVFFQTKNISSHNYL